MTNIEIVGIIKILLGIIAIGISLFKGIRLVKARNPETIGLFGIWFFGLLAFLFGLLGQTLQMIGVFDSIRAVGDVSASIVADGISKSSNHTISGLMILIFSIFLWGVVKTVKNSQIRKKLTS